MKHCFRVLHLNQETMMIKRKKQHGSNYLQTFGRTDGKHLSSYKYIVLDFLKLFYFNCQKLLLHQDVMLWFDQMSLTVVSHWRHQQTHNTRFWFDCHIDKFWLVHRSHERNITWSKTDLTAANYTVFMQPFIACNEKLIENIGFQSL